MLESEMWEGYNESNIPTERSCLEATIKGHFRPHIRPFIITFRKSLHALSFPLRPKGVQCSIMTLDFTYRIFESKQV